MASSGLVMSRADEEQTPDGLCMSRADDNGFATNNILPKTYQNNACNPSSNTASSQNMRMGRGDDDPTTELKLHSLTCIQFSHPVGGSGKQTIKPGEKSKAFKI